MRFLLIDRFTSFEPGVRGGAVKNIALSEDLFDDHFPLEPIFPGVLIIEGMAQLSGALLEEGIRVQTERCVKAVLTIVEKAKFRRLVRPGDRLDYTSVVESWNELGGTTRSEARIGESTVTQCRLTFAFQALSNPALEEKRRAVLAVWLRGLEGHGSE